MKKCLTESCVQECPRIGIGERAPNFCTSAYYCGREIEVCLEDYLGKWLLVFFYSSDFTFV
ncbi:AhpC/TSA family protein [Sporomusa malonica]|uniref:AhpC/TSA family protein n=2 Tax=Sporomusa malonica TaxID=112901 RepID=A0A1W2EL23_9FIRM|nr:AhpC/TSA family protein [Sporomusa malonica]